MMTTLRQLASILARDGKVVQWTTQTGLLVRNAYYEPNVTIVELPSRGDGRRGASASVASTEHLPAIRPNKCRSSISANFIHSLDGTHLAKTVLACADGGIELLCVHDSFATLAPSAWRIHDILNAELEAMYTGTKPLVDLVRSNLKRVYARVRLRGDWFYAAKGNDEPKRVLKLPSSAHSLNPAWLRKSLYTFS